MKKSIILLLFAVFSLSAGAATYFEIKGDKQEAARYEVVCLTALMIPAIHSMRLTQSMGLITLMPENAPRVYSRSHKHILDYLNGRLPGTKPKNDLLQDLAAGKLKIEPYHQSLRFSLTSGGQNRQELMNLNTAASQGRIPLEFDKGQLPGGTVIAFDFLRAGYATDATATVPEGDIDFASVVDSWPKALRNADLIWTQMNDRKFRLGMTAFGTKAASQHPSVKGDGYEFNEPVLIEEKKQNVIEIYCPYNQALPSTANTYFFLELTMDGAALIQTR